MPISEICNCSNFFGPCHIGSLRQNPTAEQEGMGWGEKELESILSPGSRWARAASATAVKISDKEHKRRIDLNNCILAYAQVVHNGYLQIRLLFRHQHNFIFGRRSSA